MLRVRTPLTQDVEDMVHRTIGCAITVHRTLGPGLLEQIYVLSVAVELEVAGLPFEREKQYAVHYRGRFLCNQRLDLVVAGQIALEIKSVGQVAPVHYAQLLSYLHVAGLKIGLLMNFNVPILQDGVKRVVL